MKIVSLLLMLLLSIPLFADDSASIDRIVFERGENRFDVFVLGEGKLECNTVIMSKPPRIALDFPNVKNSLYPNSIEAEDNEFVQKIRTSQYAKGRDTVSRVLVDLKGQFDYKVKKAQGGIVLQLFTNPPKKKEVEIAEQLANEEEKVAKNTKPTTAASDKKQDNGTKTEGKSPAPGKSPASTRPATSRTTLPSTTVQKSIPPSAIPPPSPPVLVIGPEDLLEITVFELPQFNTTTRVLGDGNISIPLVGSVEVRGLNKAQTEQKISTALQKYVNNASVSVTIKEYKSQQISIIGAVRSPGAYYVTSQRNLLQLITEAGGLAAEAGNKCFVFRPGSPKIEINLYDLINNGNPEQNIAIYPGDVVNIPGQQKVIVYVFGAVRSPGAIELNSSMPLTFLAAIAKAGGPSEQADKSDIKLKRKGPDGTETIIKINMKDILKGKAEDILIEPGDVINVSESFF